MFLKLTPTIQRFIIVSVIFTFSFLQTAVAGDQLLVNPGFEDASGTGWTFADWNGSSYIKVSAAGHIVTNDNSLYPYSGTYMWHVGDTSKSKVYQDIDLLSLGYEAYRLNSGGYYIRYGGYDYSGGADDVLISLYQKRSSGAANGTTNLEWHSDKAWTHRSGALRLNAGTAKLTFEVIGDRDWGINNDANFDQGYLNINEYDFWTYGDTSHNRTGNGNWNPGYGEFKIGNNGYGSFYISNS